MMVFEKKNIYIYIWICFVLFSNLQSNIAISPCADHKIINTCVNLTVNMSKILEESLREASCIGDLEMVQNLVKKNVNINSKHSINGWTPLHWACQRGHEQIVQYLLTNGADISVSNNKGESPVTVCSNPTILSMLGVRNGPIINKTQSEMKFVPNYIAHPPLNGHVDVDLRPQPRRDSYISSSNTRNDNLVLRIRVAGTEDPDFIEIELPKKITYNTLLSISCQELCVKETQVERIRKLPNIRLRNDDDVKRLLDQQYLELVLYNDTKSELKQQNPYPLISTCKNQTILY